MAIYQHTHDTLINQHPVIMYVVQREYSERIALLFNIKKETLTIYITPF